MSGRQCVTIQTGRLPCAVASDALVKAFPIGDFVAISPYLVDPRTSKKVNVGDGFILDSALKLLGSRPARVISSRLAISEEDLDAINSSRMLLVAGANTLKYDFQITPDFTPQLLDRIQVPVVLLGIGHYGTYAATAQPLLPAAEAVMREILQRFPYVSVRCDASAGYLRSSIPDLAPQVLMTSCPVAYPVDKIFHGFERKTEYDQLVCTVTDRQALGAQLPLLNIAPQLFPSRRRILALHQDYENKGLWDLARSLGFEVFRGNTYESFLDLYRDTDIHIGNRLHAHLKCLSYGRRSFLTPFDLRQQFFAESLDFPLIQRLPDLTLDSYDFARYGARLGSARTQMDIFLAAARRLLGHPGVTMEVS